MATARMRQCLTGSVSVRVFTEFQYATLKTWRCERRVIGKAEIGSFEAQEEKREKVSSFPLLNKQKINEIREKQPF